MKPGSIQAGPRRSLALRSFRLTPVFRAGAKGVRLHALLLLLAAFLGVTRAAKSAPSSPESAPSSPESADSSAGASSVSADSASADSASADEDWSLDLLTIGSTAPPLDIEHWFGNSGKAPVTKYEPGRVYVVEFWATWCAPCIANKPHMAELQAKYADDQVTVINVTSDSIETVESFLEKPLMSSKAAPTGPGTEGAEDQDTAVKQEGRRSETYADFTRAFRLCADPDGSTKDAYLGASLESGIPVAFVVGKSGVIEWIGWPNETLDQVVDDLIHDRWDRNTVKAAFQTKQRVSLLCKTASKALENRETDAVLDVIDQLKRVEGHEGAAHYAWIYERGLLFIECADDIKADPQRSAELIAPYINAAIEKPRSLLFDGMKIAHQVENQELALDREGLRVVAKACLAPVESGDAGIDEGALLNTAGKLYCLAKDRATAEALHERAVAYAKKRSKGQLPWFERDLQALRDAAPEDSEPSP